MASHYALNLQITPYHLFYVLAVGVSLASTPLVATKLLLSVSALIYLLGVRRILGTENHRWPALLAAALLFFNVSFFYGFVVMLVGIPFVVLGAAALLDLGAIGGRRPFFEATLCGLLAVSSHVLLAPAWALALAAALVQAAPAHRPRLLLSASISSLPLLPALTSALSATAGAGPRFEYASLNGFLYYLSRHLVLFDHSLGAAALGVVLLLLIGLAGVDLVRAMRAPRRSGRELAWHAGLDYWRSHRFALVFLGLSATAYTLLPLELVTSDGPVWGLNLRYSVFVGLGLVFLWPTELPARLSRFAAVLACLAFLAYFVSLYGFWSRFDTATVPIDRVLATMEPNRTLTTAVAQERFEAAWPPVRLHTHAYYLAEGGAFDDRVFAGGHLPIRALAEPQRDCDLAPSLCIGEFDYLLVQDDGDTWHAEEPADGHLILQAGDWRLYSRLSPVSGSEPAPP